MYPLKQKEQPHVSLAAMSAVFCTEGPKAAGCKRYLQWLTLNSFEVNDHTHSNDAQSGPGLEHSYYRSKAIEIFW